MYCDVTRTEKEDGDGGMSRGGRSGLLSSLAWEKSAKELEIGVGIESMDEFTNHFGSGQIEGT